MLILDEPTKALDAAATEVVAAAIDRRLAEGAAVLFATHDLAFARRLADRSVVMVDGRISWQGPPEDLLAESDLLTAARLLA